MTLPVMAVVMVCRVYPGRYAVVLGVPLLVPCSIHYVPIGALMPYAQCVVGSYNEGL